MKLRLSSKISVGLWAGTQAAGSNDQQTLAMQNRAMREYAGRRGWIIALQVREVNSGAVQREARESCWKLLAAARSMLCWCGASIAGDDR